MFGCLTCIQCTVFTHKPTCMAGNGEILIDFSFNFICPYGAVISSNLVCKHFSRTYFASKIEKTSILCFSLFMSEHNNNFLIVSIDSLLFDIDDLRNSTFAQIGGKKPLIFSLRQLSIGAYNFYFHRRSLKNFTAIPYINLRCGALQ